MHEFDRRNRRVEAAGILALCVLVIVTRLYHLNAPIADNLQAKQTYSTNKARNIARAPFDPMRLSLDLLDEDGRRMELAEEAPLYIGMLGGMFTLWGEREAWGRLLSIAGTLIAVLCFHALARRSLGANRGWVASLLFACAPLLIFYGRAIMPDSWMLAMMLASAAAHQRYLDRGGKCGLAAAMICGGLAPLFKYWGLMILLILADMTRAARGWRGLRRWDFVLLGLSVASPTAWWIVFVFLPAPNPVHDGWVAGQPPAPYLVFQQPLVLLNRAFYAGLVSRFLIRDCGPVLCVLLACAGWAAARRRLPARVEWQTPLRWAVTGIAFYFLLAPKLVDHDYYELMLLPAAALLGAAGWSALAQRAPPRSHAAGLATLAAAVAIHSPWVSGGLFQLDEGKVALGHALGKATTPRGRVVAIGPAIAMIVPVHYSKRAGWAVRATRLPHDWPKLVTRWRRQGAEAIGLYFDAKTDASARASFDPLIHALGVSSRHIEQRNDDNNRIKYEYLVLAVERSRG